MQLSERQQQQVEGIASLVTQSNWSAIRQGIELAVALDDQDVFAELLDGVAVGASLARRPRNYRYPTLERATRFDTGLGNQAWLDLAMVHLLAASDLPLRTQVTSIALGTPKRRFANPAPRLWLDGLERLTALTHLDIHLDRAERGFDLRGLASFPSLTHLRVRGPGSAGPIPALTNLREVSGAQLAFEEGAKFPSLRSVSGRIVTTRPLSPETMPKLAAIDARGGVRVAGFESLDRLWCSSGDYEIVGCRRVENLRVNATSFRAPDLRHVGLFGRLGESADVSQLETLREVKLNVATKLSRCHFPDGTRLVDPRVVLFGSSITDLGNIGHLSGMEILRMARVVAPVSLEPLRHANDLRVLDIRNSTGITDLSPIAELPKLEVLVLTDRDRDRYDIPARLVERIQRSWRPTQVTKPTGTRATTKA